MYTSAAFNCLKAAVADDSSTKLRVQYLYVIGRELAFSWALCAVCLFGHLSHFFGAKAAWIHAFHSTGFHLSLSLFTLLGPGRKLILDGIKSLIRGAPNMNTLVGLGALSSFSVSTLAAFIPKLVIGDLYLCYFFSSMESPTLHHCINILDVISSNVLFVFSSFGLTFFFF